jgi:phosphoribosyl 1,2-cyclic phosphodiesterase
VKITFLGTRGYIDIRTKKHYRHTATLIEYNRKRVLIDCGIDWLGRLKKIDPHAIILTHAHPDHAWGLQKGAPCPVYATRDSWYVKELKKFPIKNKITITDRQIFTIGAITFEVFSEVHSLRCPAVGYRITAGKVTIFYAGDLVSINERHDALKNIQLYIGDGATIVRSMVRAKDGKLFGHTPIKTQLGWCKKEQVPRAIFTHCGTQIVSAKPSVAEEKIELLGHEFGVHASIAYDGMGLILK